MIILLYNLITPKKPYYLDIRFIIALNMILELLNSSKGLSGGLKQKISSLNRTKKSIEESEQTRTLKKLLIQAKNTEFGTFHSFKEILNSDDPVNMYKAYVPLTSYDGIYDNWIKHSMNGLKNVTWPGQTSFFAMSSGTTKGNCKYIPVSDEMLSQFQRTSYRQLIGMMKNNFNKSIYKSKVLNLGGSTKLENLGFCKVGDLSGILSRKKSWSFSPIAKPGKKISMLRDWDEKMDQIVKKAPKWNIGVIAGAPSWTLKLLNRIIDEYELDSIHDMWPNLQLYLHGGLFLEPYKERLDQIMGKPIAYQNTFLASEGYFGYQSDLNSEYMELLTDSGVYFEFIEQKYFDKIINYDFTDVKTVSLDEVKPNTIYSLVISTCSGLWRYSMGDLVSFNSLGSKAFKIVGRVAYDLNVAGEHLTEEIISNAIMDVSKMFDCEILEFCVYPNKKTDRHDWYIGPNKNVCKNKFAVLLDQRLKELNQDYQVVRRFHLKTPRVKVLPIDKFYEFMQINGKSGSQNKFPRVINRVEIKKWECFLSNSEVFRKSTLND
jgi:hypothetical protein